jgi:hypothetical protein
MRRFQLPLLGSNQDSPDPEGPQYPPELQQLATISASSCHPMLEFAGFHVGICRTPDRGWLLRAAPPSRRREPRRRRRTGRHPANGRRFRGLGRCPPGCARSRPAPFGRVPRGSLIGPPFLLQARPLSGHQLGFQRSSRGKMRAGCLSCLDRPVSLLGTRQIRPSSSGYGWYFSVVASTLVLFRPPIANNPDQGCSTAPRPERGAARLGLVTQVLVAGS